MRRVTQLARQKPPVLIHNRNLVSVMHKHQVLMMPSTGSATKPMVAWGSAAILWSQPGTPATHSTLEKARQRYCCTNVDMCTFQKPIVRQRESWTDERFNRYRHQRAYSAEIQVQQNYLSMHNTPTVADAQQTRVRSSKHC